jgi:hypothetical protein
MNDGLACRHNGQQIRVTLPVLVLSIGSTYIIGEISLATSSSFPSCGPEASRGLRCVPLRAIMARPLQLFWEKPHGIRHVWSAMMAISLFHPVSVIATSRTPLTTASRFSEIYQREGRTVMCFVICA